MESCLYYLGPGLKYLGIVLLSSKGGSILISCTNEGNKKLFDRIDELQASVYSLLRDGSSETNLRDFLCSIELGFVQLMPGLRRVCTGWCRHVLKSKNAALYYCSVLVWSK